MVEFSIDLSATYDNPFDPEDIDVSATITPPQGAAVTVPAFLGRPFRRTLEGKEEVLTPTAEAGWRLRGGDSSLRSE